MCCVHPMRDAATIVRGESGQSPQSHQRSNLERGVQAETNKQSFVTAQMKSMKAIVVTDQAAGTAGMKLVERPEPPAAINDVIVQIHASGFVPTELAWPSTGTEHRRSPATSWPEWSPLSATARRDCR